MKFVDSLIDTIEELVWWGASGLKQHLSDYIAIETADSKNTLVLKDGSLMSIVRVEGSRQLIGSKEFGMISGAINKSLETYLSAAGGHAIQVFFLHDKERIRTKLESLYAASRRAGENIGFNIDDIVEDRISALSSHCHVEDCFFVLRTRLDAVSQSDLKRSHEMQSEAVKVKKGAIAILAQNPILAVDALRDRHNSFVRSFTADLNEAGIVSMLLDAHESCREIRRSIDPEFTSDEWEPYLPGDKMPARLPYIERDDLSNILWPKLSTQLTPRSGKALDHQFFQIGNRIYATVSVDLPPKDPKYFNVLFKRMISTNIPWRASFGLESGGLRSVQLKRTFAAIAGFAHANNRLIVDAYDALESDVRRLGTVDARLTMCFSTWVSDGDIKKLSSRVSALARAVEGWGVCEVSEIPGDPVTGFMTTVLGQNTDGTAVPSAAVLSDAVNMLPITRSASPWREGTLMFRTPDGKVWPYQPGSPLQVAWIDLIFAGMGSGKSVLMNSINLALCTDPRNKRLPRIVTIDIGPSSEGLISLLRDQLPAERKHEAVYQRLRMINECAINPFDTVLGSRYPISSHRAFLRNFLLLLATPVGQDKPYDGVADMIGIAIDETYKRMADGVNPRRYDVGVDPFLDDLLFQLEIKTDKRTTWWELVDELYRKGKTREAGMAQRYAMPTLDDLIESARSEQIRDIFKIELVTKETLVEGFCRSISTAINNYPIISKPTKFDISESRVVALDLDEVAKTGGESADRQTAIMYMLARFVLARDFYLTEENLVEMNKDYTEYHKRRIKEGSEDIKRICIDEFHRTRRVQSVRDQIVTDIREGRKWGVHVALASQNMEDFDDVMISLASSIFIMGKFDASDVNAIDERFDLGETARYALTNTTHGPRPGVGTTFLVNMVTNDSNQRTTQAITSTIGPIEYWAFSTTAEDKVIRSQIYNKIGGKAARLLLSRTYPWGISKEVSRRASDMSETEAFDDNKRNSVIDTIRDEVMETYYKEQRKTGG